MQKVVIGREKPLKGRPGSNFPPADLKAETRSLTGKLKREVGDDDLYSHFMYPEVFAEFAKFTRD